MRILKPESMSRRVSPLAGFQVTIIGRFWVTTEDFPKINRASSVDIMRYLLIQDFGEVAADWLMETLSIG
jgi:hypothetical protein